MLTAGENKNSPSPTRKRKSWSDVEEDVRNDVTNDNPADVANDDNHDDHTSDLEYGSVRAQKYPWWSKDILVTLQLESAWQLPGSPKRLATIPNFLTYINYKVS